MTAKRDFKRVVRARMAKTGETYTQARHALITETLARIDELLAEFAKTEGDRIDREHLIVEAANLAVGTDASSLDGETMRKVFWLTPTDVRLEMLDEFLNQDRLGTEDLAWAYEQRLIMMGSDEDQFSAEVVVAAHEAFFDWVKENLDEASQGKAFINPPVWWRWHQAERGVEFFGRMATCVGVLPIVPENKMDRLFLSRNLLMRAARQDDADAIMRYESIIRSVFDEPGELPDDGDPDRRLTWEGILRMTPLIAADRDPARAAPAAEVFAEWIRNQDGTADGLLGEIAALCMFQGHYELAERYAQEALDSGQGKINALIFVWRAGGHLGATGDVASTVPLLEEARRHVSAGELERFLDQQVPFTEYSDDERLREVVGIRP